MPTTPSLKDCDYTAFISYAHADDEAWFHWVTQFRTELERGLAALLRGVKLPPMHLSADNGPVAGLLGDQLRQRIARSFATVIVVHDNYAQSEWCLRELQAFHELFGNAGLAERLYIVAMGESAMLSVAGGKTWQALLPGGEQVWIPFFEEQDRDRPRDVYLAPGLVSPTFRAPFERLRSDLAAKLKASARQPPQPGPTPEPVAEPVVEAQPQPGTAVQPAPGLLFGFVAPAAAAGAAAAVAALAARGVAAKLLTQDTVFSDFAEFDAADRLVLAFDDSAPMLTALAPGGHLQLQRDAWLKRGKPADSVFWLDLQPGTPPPPQVQALQAQPLPLPALLQKLAPAAPAPQPAPSAVRIYIESNRHERTLWEPLGAWIEHEWEVVCRRIAPDRVPPLSLRSRGLPVDRIDEFGSLDDADGVVLLWGKKTSEALVAQINKVEMKLAPGRDAAPGIVAYLMPPQESSEPVPAWGWQVLRFDARDEAAIDVVGDERDDLQRFLEKVFRRHQKRSAA